MDEVQSGGGLCGFDVSPRASGELEESQRTRMGRSIQGTHDGRKKEPWDQGVFDIVTQLPCTTSSRPPKLADHFFANCTALSTPTTKLVITYVDEERLRRICGEEDEYMPNFCTVSTQVSSPLRSTVPLHLSPRRIREPSSPGIGAPAVLVYF